MYSMYYVRAHVHLTLMEGVVLDDTKDRLMRPAHRVSDPGFLVGYVLHAQEVLPIFCLARMLLNIDKTSWTCSIRNNMK